MCPKHMSKRWPEKGVYLKIWAKLNIQNLLPWGCGPRSEDRDCSVHPNWAGTLGISALDDRQFGSKRDRVLVVVLHRQMSGLQPGDACMDCFICQGRPSHLQRGARCLCKSCCIMSGHLIRGQKETWSSFKLKKKMGGGSLSKEEAIKIFTPHTHTNSR